MREQDAEALKKAQL